MVGDRGTGNPDGFPSASGVASEEKASFSSLGSYDARTYGSPPLSFLSIERTSSNDEALSMVGDRGVEPLTSSTSKTRSSQLS